MAEEEVGKVHNSLIPGSNRVEAAKGTPVGGGASTSLHQPDKTSKLSVGITESLTTLKQSAGRRRMTQLPYPARK